MTLTKVLNLLLSTDSEAEALEAWRQARRLQPSGKLGHQEDPEPKAPSRYFKSPAWQEYKEEERKQLNEQHRRNKIRREALMLEIEALKLNERFVELLREAAALMDKLKGSP